MGQAQSALDSGTDWEWTFVGRENDLNELLSLVNKNRIVEIFGILQIGKSRLLLRLISKLLENQSVPKKKILFFDFYLYQGSAVTGLVDCLKGALDTFDIVLQTPLKNLDNIGEVTRTFIDAVKDVDEELIICLDNLQIITESNEEKEKLLSFMRNVVKDTKLKLIVATNDKIGFADKGFKSYELGPLEESDVLELIHEITEEKLRDDKVHMPLIAKLCEGLPLAAMVTANELKDDFFEPCEILELLLKKRREALSSDILPAEERFDYHNKTIDKIQLEPYLYRILRQLADNTTGTTITIDEAVHAREDDNVTRAGAKQDAQKLQQKGIVTNLQKKLICLPGVKRECTLLHNIKTSIDLPEDEKKACEEILRKAMEENVTRAGLDIPAETLDNPRQLAAYLEALDPSTGKSVLVLIHKLLSGINLKGLDIPAETLNNPRQLAAYIEALDPSTGKKAIEHDDTPSSSLNNLNEPRTGLSVPSQSDPDSSVSSSSDNLDSVANGQSVLPSGISGQPEGLDWNIVNIPADSATGDGHSSSESRERRVSSELNDDSYSLVSGPPAMSYRNESFPDMNDLENG